jgi:hopene-associated glycosyltransferase HpnB
MLVALFILSALSLLFWAGIALRPGAPWIPYADAGGRTELERGAGEVPAAREPLVSVVIPARDEEATIGAALGSHFESAWPSREVILVDDGSHDRTEAVAREAAAGAPCRFEIVRPGDVPEGWVGKVRAMDAGVREARGRYILFTDADIVFSPDLMTNLVRESETHGLGLNSRMVLLAARSFWERLLVPAFVFFFCLMYPFRAVAKPRTKTAAAAGGCMLVAREALEAAGGMAGIKDAIIDDMALARRIKGAGFPLRLALTKKAQSLRRYERLRDFWQTVARTAFTELKYSWLRLGATAIAMILAFVVPIASACAGLGSGEAGMAALGLAALALSLLLYYPHVAFLGVPARYVLLFPLVGVLYLAMTWHSAARYAGGTRSVWKERAYKRTTGAD